MKRIICDSGIEGWKATVQENWGTLDELRAYDETYGICGRLGFDSPEAAWEANPMIQGSVIPSDLRCCSPALTLKDPR